LSNLPSGATVTWQVSSSTNASVSGSGSSAVVTPLIRGTFTLTANINIGGATHTVTKNIIAGANISLNAIRVREQYLGAPWIFNHEVNYGSSYYFELYPQDALVTKYEWQFSTHSAFSYYWNSYSYPYTVGASGLPAHDSIAIRLIHGGGNDLIIDPPTTLNVYSRFRDCFGWSDIHDVLMLTINYPIVYSAAYPNPASNELIIDKESNNNNLNVSSANNIQTAKANNNTVKVLLYSHSSAKLVYSQDFSQSAEQIRINTSQLPNGVYYLNMIANGEKIKEQTIIINH
jgi:hypothetical protein